MGSIHATNARFYSTLPLIWSDGPIKILDLQIMPQLEEIIHINFEIVKDRVRQTLASWKNRSLTPVGKIQIINT